MEGFSVRRQLRGFERTAGFSLVEIAVALSILVVVGVSVCITMLRGMQHRRESAQDYQALAALRNVLADIQETANLPLSLVNTTGIGALYAKYHGTTTAVSGLPSGQVTVTCYPNEAAVPAVFGGPQDLNFDGDAADDLGNQSAGWDMKLVPATVTVSYVEGGQTRTIVAERLFTMTAEKQPVANPDTSGSDPYTDPGATVTTQ